MDSSFLSRALEQAKQLQKIAADAAQKGYEQAMPLVQEGVAKAQELQKTIVEQTPNMTAAAQQQANAAMEHAGAFIATGKTVLEAGAAQAQTHLSTFAEQAKKAADATVSAVQSATQKGEAAASGATPGAGTGPVTPEAGTPGAAPPPGTASGTGTPGSSTPL
ncbi:MAG TPA: hypothetical protein VHS78_19980 [Candidatus Elarobacter sp.]|jgi:uncharacterized protein (DUF885 family)|nr:hypothetical protein [Candidatus Elarobacter sp.]